MPRAAWILVRSVVSRLGVIREGERPVTVVTNVAMSVE